VSSSGDGDEAADTGDAGNTDGASDAEADESDWWEDPEPDPPSLGPDPPSVDVPEVEVPETPSATGDTDVDVDADTAREFWRLVLIFDVALLALALGPMFVYFMDDWRRGGLLLGFGLLAFLYGVARYREFQTAAENTGDDDAGNDDAGNDGDVGDVVDEG